MTCWLRFLCIFRAGTSRHQWPPGSSSPLYRTSPCRAAQKLACVGIGLLSIPSVSPPLCRGSFARLCISCIAGRDVPSSVPLPCLRRHTTSTCRRLGVRTMSGPCLPVCFQTSVRRPLLPGASHCALGRVSCCQLCLSACGHDAYCICRPATPPLPLSLLLGFVWSCSPPMCILALILCLPCETFFIDSHGDVLPHFQGFQRVLGTSGLLSLFWHGIDSLRSGLSTWPDAALVQVPGAPFFECLLVSR